MRAHRRRARRRSPDDASPNGTDVVKRLLFITYEFPPKGGTQSQHVAGLACRLAALGWDVTVLTVDDPPISLVDEALLARAEACVTIARAWSLEPTRLVQALHGARRRRVSDGAAHAAGARGVTSAPRWFIRLVQACFIPDEKVGWTGFAVREAARLHSLAPFDAALSSAPPFTAHGVARTVARRLRLPWIADLRDPIVGGYFFKPASPLHAWLLRRFEKRTVAGADVVLAATDGIRDGILSRVPGAAGRVLTEPNGFDPDDFPGAAPSAGSGAFVVSYVGAFQATIRPDVFLAAVASLRAADPDFARDVRVRFVGPLDPETTVALARMGATELVERTGFVTYPEAITAMRASSVNLLVLGPEPASRGIMTSKLPEYLAAGRPVLALVPSDGVAADIVRRARAGEVVPPDDPDAVAGAIGRLYEQWKAGAAAAPDPAVVAEFDRGALAGRIDGLLRELIAKAAGDA
jgi:glycosyltransferase involved in cell wall biosynthesis